MVQQMVGIQYRDQIFAADVSLKIRGRNGATMETIGILDGFCWNSLIWVISPPPAPQGSRLGHLDLQSWDRWHLVRHQGEK